MKPALTKPHPPASRPRGLDRREFLSAAALAALSMPAISYSRILGSNQRLNVAYIGVGGIAGGQHIAPLAGLGAGCPCYCDADARRWGAAADRWADAEGFTDYRKMFDERHKDIDAVMVGTPDHHHYPATIIAMMHGKHVYTQKPLTHTVWEARQLAMAQQKYKVATQMGNQGHASESLRKTIDYLRSGAIGDLVEAHVWTDRPWWRQGIQRPEGAQPVPEKLDWDAWIGPAPMRPFRHDPADRWGGLYHPFNWRGWWDFGCGALGDMACHEMDPVYWAMEPGYPKSVELVHGEPIGDGEMYKEQSTVKYEFEAKADRPAFTLFWHEGGRKPEPPAELEAEWEAQHAAASDKARAEGAAAPARPGWSNEGAYYIGTKGKMVALPHARAAPRLLPQSRHEEFGAPPRQIERSQGHHNEWFDACTGKEPFDHPKCNFSYAGPFTETVLLGCVVQKTGGQLLYDGSRITNNDAANALLTKEYREGWDFRME